MTIKKNLIILMIASFTLTGCIRRGGKKSSSSGSVDSSSNSGGSSAEFVGGDLIFSELYVGEVYADRAFELANVGKEELDLSKYTVKVFRDAGAENPVPTETIKLSGHLSPNKACVVAYDGASQVILDKANIIVNNFLNDGTFPMTINNSDGDIVDYLGYPGYFYDVANHADTVRKVECLSASTFSAYDWIRYPVSCLDNLGNLNCLDNDTIYNGPKLSQKDFDNPYVVDGHGGGGCLKVTLSSTIDGDTTRFNFGNSLAAYDISGTYPMRYYGINTPELPHGGNPADPYGYEARDFTNSIINSSKHFVVQSVRGYSLTETYGRMLGYVWVSNLNNPQPEDYVLLNHYILLNGYARVGHIDRGGYNDYMLYNGISYTEYLYDAQQYAIKNKLHIFEES